MNVFGLLDIYFLMLIIINSFVSFFVDSAYYQRNNNLRMKLHSRILSVIILILGIALFISGQILGGI